jgi:hypothetical protein
MEVEKERMPESMKEVTRDLLTWRAVRDTTATFC